MELATDENELPGNVPQLYKHTEDIYSLDVYVHSFSLPTELAVAEKFPGSSQRLSVAFHFLDYQPIVFSSAVEVPASPDGFTVVPIQKGQSCYFRAEWATLHQQLKRHPLHAVLLRRDDARVDGHDRILATKEVSLGKLSGHKPQQNGRLFDPRAAASGAADASFFHDSQVFHEAHCTLKFQEEPTKPPLFAKMLFYVRLRCFEFGKQQRPATHRHTHTIEKVKIVVKDQGHQPLPHSVATVSTAGQTDPPAPSRSVGDRDPLTFQKELHNLAAQTREQQRQLVEQDRMNNRSRPFDRRSNIDRHHLDDQTYASRAAAALRPDVSDDAFRVVTKPTSITAPLDRPPLLQFSKTRRGSSQTGTADPLDDFARGEPTGTRGGRVARQNAYAVGALRLLAQKCTNLVTNRRARQSKATINEFASEKYEPRASVTLHANSNQRLSTAEDCINIGQPKSLAADTVRRSQKISLDTTSNAQDMPRPQRELPDHVLDFPAKDHIDSSGVVDSVAVGTAKRICASDAAAAARLYLGHSAEDQEVSSRSTLSDEITTRRKNELKMMWMGKIPVSHATSASEISAQSVIDDAGRASLSVDASRTESMPGKKILSECQSEEHQKLLTEFTPKDFLSNAKFNAEYCEQCILTASSDLPQNANQSGSTSRAHTLPSLQEKIEGLLFGALLGSAISQSIKSVVRRGILLQNHHSKTDGMSSATDASHPFGQWARDLALHGGVNATTILQMNGLQAPRSIDQSQLLLSVLLAERFLDRHSDLMARKTLRDLDTSINELEAQLSTMLQSNSGTNAVLQQIVRQQVAFTEKMRDSLQEQRAQLLRRDCELKEFRESIGTRVWWSRTLEQQHAVELASTDPDTSTSASLQHIPLGSSVTGTVDSFGDPVSAVLVNEIVAWAKSVLKRRRGVAETTNCKDDITQRTHTEEYEETHSDEPQLDKADPPSAGSVLKSFARRFISWSTTQVSHGGVPTPKGCHSKVGLARIVAGLQQQNVDESPWTAEPQQALLKWVRRMWKQSSGATFDDFSGQGKLPELISQWSSTKENDLPSATNDSLNDFVPWGITLLSALSCTSHGDGQHSASSAKVVEPEPAILGEADDEQCLMQRASVARANAVQVSTMDRSIEPRPTDLSEDVIRMLSLDPRCIAAGRAASQLASSLFSDHSTKMDDTRPPSSNPSKKRSKPQLQELSLPSIHALDPPVNASDPPDRSQQNPTSEDVTETQPRTGKICIDNAALATMACAAGIEVLHSAPHSGSSERAEPGQPPQPHSSLQHHTRNDNSRTGTFMCWNPYEPEMSREEIQSALLWVCDPTLRPNSSRTARGRRRQKPSKISDRTQGGQLLLLSSTSSPPFDVLRTSIGCLQSTQEFGGQGPASFGGFAEAMSRVAYEILSSAGENSPASRGGLFSHPQSKNAKNANKPFQPRSKFDEHVNIDLSIPGALLGVALGAQRIPAAWIRFGLGVAQQDWVRQTAAILAAALEPTGGDELVDDAGDDFDDRSSVPATSFAVDPEANTAPSPANAGNAPSISMNDELFAAVATEILKVCEDRFRPKVEHSSSELRNEGGLPSAQPSANLSSEEVEGIARRAAEQAIRLHLAKLEQPGVRSSQVLPSNSEDSAAAEQECPSLEEVSLLLRARLLGMLVCKSSQCEDSIMCSA